MTDKERLEELKLAAENNFFTGCPGDGTTFEFDEQVNWLIEQAEKAQKLELEIEQDGRQAMLEGLYAGNQELRFKYRRIDNILSSFKWDHEQSIHEIKYLNEMIRDLTRENKRYRAALEFYADKENYDVWEGRKLETDYVFNVHFDGGDKARQALEDAE